MACTRSVTSLLRHGLIRSTKSAIAPRTLAARLPTIDNAVAAISRPSLLPTSSCTTSIINRSLVTSVHHMTSAGDNDLSAFLMEEIAHERENVMEDTPSSFKGFNISMSGTEVTLKRKLNNETVQIYFDINDNRNVDENLDQAQEGDEDVGGAIVSYPEFQVSISKPSGKTIQFVCVYEASEFKDDDEGQQEEGEQNFDIFRINAVTVLEDGPVKQADVKGVYESETTNMDPSLYAFLMDMMAERGVDVEFVQELLELSTDLEHKYYVNFLTDLKKFVDGN